MEIAQKQQTCKIQDALKKRYASTLFACMIHAAKCSGAVINTDAGNHSKPVNIHHFEILYTGFTKTTPVFHNKQIYFNQSLFSA